METWQMMVGLAAMLVLYVLVGAALGRDLTPIDLILGVVFGAIGLYAGEILSNRLSSGEE